jgi:hypothetical protein
MPVRFLRCAKGTRERKCYEKGQCGYDPCRDRYALGPEALHGDKVARFDMAKLHRLLELSQDSLQLGGREFASLRIVPGEIHQDRLNVSESVIVVRVLLRYPIHCQNLRCSFPFLAGNQIERVRPRQPDFSLFRRRRFWSRFRCRRFRRFPLNAFPLAVIGIPKAFQFALFQIILVVPRLLAA